MRAGVIGIGAMGQHHVRIYDEMENVELVGISDVSESRVNELAGQYGVKGYTDHRQLLEQGLDVLWSFHAHAPFLPFIGFSAWPPLTVLGLMARRAAFRHHGLFSHSLAFGNVPAFSFASFMMQQKNLMLKKRN